MIPNLGSQRKKRKMSEDDKQKNLPEGRRVSKAKSRRETLYLKRQQLLKEMQSEEDLRPISVREQVDKLKSASQDGGAKGGDEDSWGAKEKRRKGSPWMLWALMGLAIPVVLVGLMLMSKKSASSTLNDSGATGLDFDVLSGGGKMEPEDWFVENSGSSFSTGVEILEQLSEEELTVADVAPLVRTEKQARLLADLHKKGTWAAFDTRQPSNLLSTYGSSAEVGFMTMTGVRSDFRDFRAYFVRKDEKLVLDVEATEARSEIPVAKLTQESLQGPVQLRCWVAKEPHFDARSDEKLFSWYQILAPDEVDFVWAYCKTGDPLDEILRKELNYGRLIGDRKTQFRATIKVSHARGFRDDEFLFDELLATEWVLPVAE